MFNGRNGFANLREEPLLIEVDLREQNYMGRVHGIALGQDSSARDPAGAAAHDFDDATGAVISGHAADIEGNFHDGGAVVFDDGAEAGAVVGVGQIVVDG